MNNWERQNYHIIVNQSFNAGTMFCHPSKNSGIMRSLISRLPNAQVPSQLPILTLWPWEGTPDNSNKATHLKTLLKSVFSQFYLKDRCEEERERERVLLYAGSLSIPQYYQSNIGKTNTSVILNGEKTRQGYPRSPLLFNIVLKVLARAIRQRIRTLRNQNQKWGIKISQTTWFYI